MNIGAYYRYFIVLLSIFLASLTNLMATEKVMNEDEQKLYEKAIQHRNAKEYNKAISYFKPLADKGYAKAQHNLAMRYLDIAYKYQTNNVKFNQWSNQAYCYFKGASDQDFAPSKNNLKKMNLLHLLLPSEILKAIAAKLEMKDLLKFGSTSTKDHDVVAALLTSTDYLHSDAAYAKHIQIIFQDVTFEPQPQSIQLVNMGMSNDNEMKIHFRDAIHLEDIARRYPLPQNSQNIYFVRDTRVIDGNEIFVTGRQLKKDYCLNIISNGPLTIKGDLRTSNLKLIKPQKVSSTNLDRKRYDDYHMYENTCKNAYDVAQAMRTFNQELFIKETTYAYNLINNLQFDRLRNPQRYPDLNILLPQVVMFSDKEIIITQHDYLKSDINPIIYIADSITNIKYIKTKLPMPDHSIHLIDPKISQPGIYSQPMCDDQFYFTTIPGSKITTLGNLIVFGNIILNNYDLDVNVEGKLWLLSSNLIGGTTRLHAKRGTLMCAYQPGNKPDDMPQSEWDKLTNHYNKLVK